MTIMTETQAAAIRKRNARYHTEADKRRNEARRKIEILEEARTLGVTVEELLNGH